MSGEQGMPAEAMECDKVNCKVQCTNYGKQVAINFFFNCKIYTHKKCAQKTKHRFQLISSSILKYAQKNMLKRHKNPTKLSEAGLIGFTKYSTHKTVQI